MMKNLARIMMIGVIGMLVVWPGYLQAGLMPHSKVNYGTYISIGFGIGFHTPRVSPYRTYNRYPNRDYYRSHRYESRLYRKGYKDGFRKGYKIGRRANRDYGYYSPRSRYTTNRHTAYAYRAGYKSGFRQGYQKGIQSRSHRKRHCRRY